MPRAVNFHEEKATLSQYQNKKNTIIISFIEKAIMPRAVNFHEEKAKKTSFLTMLYPLSQY